MTKIAEPKVELIAHRSQGEEAEEEVWKPIAGYEGLYEVSNQGRVRSLDRVVLRKNGQSQLCRGRLLKPYKKKKVAKDGGALRDAVPFKRRDCQTVLCPPHRPGGIRRGAR